MCVHGTRGCYLKNSETLHRDGEVYISVDPVDLQMRRIYSCSLIGGVKEIESCEVFEGNVRCRREDGCCRDLYVLLCEVILRTTSTLAGLRDVVISGPETITEYPQQS